MDFFQQFQCVWCMDPSVLIYEPTTERWFAIFFNLNANYLLLLFFFSLIFMFMRQSLRWSARLRVVESLKLQDEVKIFFLMIS